MKDFYDILGLDRTANHEQIKSAYRKLAKKYHPDTNKDPNAENKFKEVGEAYETLKDPNKRQEYDIMNNDPFELNLGRQRQSAGKPNNWDDVFSTMFSRFTQSSFRTNQRYPKNLDIQIDYAITLEEAYTGVSKKIDITFPGGELKTINIDIPAGVDVHTRIRLKEKGSNLNRNASPGDIFLIIQIHHHKTFQKIGADLLIEREISSIDAILGTEIILTTINGNKISIKVPEGSQANSKIRVKNHGMPILDSTRRGDLYIVLHLITPTKLTSDQKKLLEKFQISYKNT